MIRALQRDFVFVERQSVKIRAVHGGECFEFVERAFFVENLRITFERKRRIENPGAAAG